MILRVKVAAEFVEKGLCIGTFQSACRIVEGLPPDAKLFRAEVNQSRDLALYFEAGGKPGVVEDRWEIRTICIRRHVSRARGCYPAGLDARSSRGQVPQSDLLEWSAPANTCADRFAAEHPRLIGQWVRRLFNEHPWESTCCVAVGGTLLLIALIKMAVLP